MLPGAYTGAMDSRRTAVAAAGIAAFLNLYAPQSLLPTFAREFGARPETASMAVGATTLAIALSSPLAGLVAQRYARRAVLMVCFAGLLLASLGCALSDELPEILAWRFVLGLFLPPILALTMAYIGEAWPVAEAGRIMAFYVACNVVGGFSGRFLSGVAADQAGWRSSFVLLAVLNVVAGWLTLRSMPDRIEGPEQPRFEPEALARHLRDPRLRAAFATGFSVLFSLVGLFTYVTYHLAEPPFLLGPAALGSLFAVYLVGVVATPLAGRLIRPPRYGRVIVGSALAGAAGVALTLLPWLPAVLLGLVACSSAVFVSQSAATGFVSDRAGAGRATALGLYLCCYYLGGTAGAVVPGLLWQDHGWPGTVALLVAVNLATALLAGRLRVDR